jgi:LmbE family N-acetylglucosaminyl deacetylase
VPLKKILVIGPHPDDLEFGCGGTLCRFAEQNFEIILYIVTNGSFGGDVKQRRKEQEKSAKILNASLLWGDSTDTEVVFKRMLINDIESVIKKISPDLIFVNYYKDTHQDHVAVSKATITAARYMNNFLFYETPTSFEFNPNIYSNIGDVLKSKVKLLKAHSSQMNKTRVKELSVIESAKSTAVFRGYQARVKYAEAFVSQRILLDFICLKK